MTSATTGDQYNLSSSKLSRPPLVAISVLGWRISRVGSSGSTSTLSLCIAPARTIATNARISRRPSSYQNCTPSIITRTSVIPTILTIGNGGCALNSSALAACLHEAATPSTGTTCAGMHTTARWLAQAPGSPVINWSMEQHRNTDKTPLRKTMLCRPTQRATRTHLQMMSFLWHHIGTQSEHHCGDLLARQSPV